VEWNNPETTQALVYNNRFFSRGLHGEISSGKKMHNVKSTNRDVKWFPIIP